MSRRCISVILISFPHVKLSDEDEAVNRHHDRERNKE